MGSKYDFDYYLACGNRDTVSISSQPGILLIGGAEGRKSGEDEATQWFLKRAQGGKYLVLRVGGIGSQADWICTHYRDWIHSAGELSIDSREAADNPEVIEYIREADALFIAGGDQNEYQEYWEGTETEKALNYLVNEKKIPIAGTSAGMAILGDYYYAPEHQGILSSEILDDPFHYNTENIHRSDFLEIPYLKRVITDTHLDRILVTPEIIKKAQELITLGIKNFDALHLACAENNVNIFLTTDAQAKPALRARLLNKALSYQDKINVTVANPVTWLMNITNNLRGDNQNDTN